MPVISTNLAANTALRFLNINASNQSDTLAHIASGKRIVSAADDAAGLALSTRLTSDISTLEQAAINGAHGVSVLQTADGGLSKISDVLQRMKTLATQSLSGAVTDDERKYINTEFQALVEEVNSIADSTKFAGKTLLGTASTWDAGVDFLLGTDAANDTLNVAIKKADGVSLAIMAAGTGSPPGPPTSAAEVDTQANAKTAATKVDAAIKKIAEQRAELGSLISRFKFRSANIAQADENLKAANSKIVDADIAKEQAKFSSQQVLTNAAVNALAQSNRIPQTLMSLFR